MRLYIYVPNMVLMWHAVQTTIIQRIVKNGTNNVLSTVPVVFPVVLDSRITDRECHTDSYTPSVVALQHKN